MGDSSTVLSASTLSISKPAASTLRRTTSPSTTKTNTDSRYWTKVLCGSSGFFGGWKRVWTRLYIDWWLFETVNLLISLGLLIGIIAVLKSWNHRPPGDWQACLLVPVSSSICQVRWIIYKKQHPLRDFQILDGASRGVVGSLEAIIRVRDPLAVPGALVLIAMLGLEAFTQQAISINPSSNYVPVLYDLEYILEDDATDPYGSFVAKLSFEEDLAAVATTALTDVGDQAFYVTSGFSFYDGDNSLQIVRQGSGYSFFCNQYDCQSSTYATLSLCQTCTNITQDLRLECGADSSSCSRTLPSGLSLNMDEQRMVTESTPIRAGNSMLPPNLLSDFELISSTPYILYLPDGQPQKSNQSFAAAYHCQISFCATMYQLQSDTAGDLIETPFLQTTKAVPISAGSAIQLKFPPGTEEPASYFDSGNTSEVFDSGQPNLRQLYHVDTQSQLVVDNATMKSFREFFRSMWTGSVPVHPELTQAGYFQLSSGTIFQDNLNYVSFTAEDMTGTNPGPPLILYFQDEFQWCFAYVVETMSRRLRFTYGGPTYFDSVAADTPYYKVRWAWLALPFSLLLATAVLLISVAVISHMRRVPAWKASTLAVLCHGIDLKAHPELSAASEVNKMNALAKSHRFRLTLTPSGSRLLGAGEAL